MGSRKVFRIVLSSLAGAIAFAALPISFQYYWMMNIAEGDLSTLTRAAILFLGVGALIGLNVAKAKMRMIRAAVFGFLVALVLALIVVIVQWSEMNGAVHIVANILYYIVPGLCAGLASGAITASVRDNPFAV